MSKIGIMKVEIALAIALAGIIALGFKQFNKKKKKVLSDDDDIHWI